MHKKSKVNANLILTAIFLATTIFLENEHCPIINSIKTCNGATVRSLDEIKYIIIHHSAGNGNINEIDSLHRKINGWKTIGYHYIIEKDGTIYETIPLQIVTNQVFSFNKESIGVCLIGNFEIEKPTIRQYFALIKILIILKYQFPKSKIMRHGELNATQCPGKYLFTF